MNLKQKSLIISVTTITFFVLLMSWVIYGVVVVKFQEIENQRVDRNIRRVTAVITDKTNQLISKLSDWAIWDDTYKFLQDKNQEYIDSNLSQESFASLNVDEALFINKDGELVASLILDKYAATEDDFPHDLLKYFSKGSLLSTAGKTDGFNKGLLRTNDGLILFAIGQVTKSDGTGDPVGSVVFGKYFDSTTLNSLKELTQFDTSFVLWDDPKMPQDFLIAKNNYEQNNNLKTTKITSDQSISGYLVIKDIFNKPQAIVRTDITREITNFGTSGMKMLTILIIASGLVLAITNYLVLDKIILSKIFYVSQEFNTLSTSNKMVKRLQNSGGNDEIDLLRTKINDVLDSLQTTQLAVECSNNHIVITDPDGNILFANKAAEKLTGFSSSEMTGCTPRLWGRQMSPEFYKKLWHTIKTDQQVFSGEVINKNKNGQIYQAMATISPVINETGQLKGFVGIEEDITAKKLKEKEAESNLKDLAIKNSKMTQTEKAMVNLLEDARNLEDQLKTEKANVEKRVEDRTLQLSKAKAKLNASIANLPLGFLMVDVDEKISITNVLAKNILGGKTEKANLVSLKKILKPHLSFSKFIKNSHLNRSRLEFSDIVINDRFYLFLLSPVLAENNDQDCLGVVILIQDITEAKILERSKDEFFSIASHELRTPLTAIRGNTSMIQEYYKEQIKDPELSSMINDIHDSSVRLIDIVNDFLNISRLEQGRMEFSKETIAIDKIIPEIIKEYLALNVNKKVSLSFVPPTGKIPSAIADSGKVKQVLINLIGNALKFTPTGSITVHLETTDKFVKILVSDTGRGISVKQQSLLFHKFQQAGESLFTRDTVGGTGLGLYISRKMIEGMGGEIKLEKSVVNQGSTFSFTLPVAK